MLEFNFINGQRIVIGIDMKTYSKGLDKMSPGGKFITGNDFSINLDNVTLVREISEEEYNAMIQQPSVNYRGHEQIVNASVKKEE